MSEIGLIVGKLASFHEAYYRRYILFCPFHRIHLEPVVVYENGSEKMSLFCMTNDVRLINSYWDKPQVSIVAGINSPQQLANIAGRLIQINGINTQLDMIKITLNGERYRMEANAETMIAENYFDEYEFISFNGHPPLGVNATQGTHYTIRRRLQPWLVSTGTHPWG